MSELHSWLSTQHHGLRTYKSLKQKLIARASADPEHAALYRRLASMIDAYIDSFDEEPLPVDVADQVLHGYWILCVTPKTRFPGGRPTKSRRLTRSQRSN
jgi:hypothetical protein